MIWRITTGWVFNAFARPRKSRGHLLLRVQQQVEHS